MRTFSLSVLIPTAGIKSIEKTIESVLYQKYTECEIIILRNGIKQDKFPEGEEIYEKAPANKKNAVVREVFIRKKGKGNALNIGAGKAKYDFLCVLDADCVLDTNAFKEASESLTDENVIAVGGRIVTSAENENLLTFMQKAEYEKTFSVFRNIFGFLDANFLISGAYGIFRKQEFMTAGGYDDDTVGEDMELILHLQEMYKPSGKKIIYNHESICYTETPRTFIRLLRQRDRWQRGLLDSIKKHRKLLFNAKYGMLGLLVLPCQLIFELFGPVFILGQLVTVTFIAVDFRAFFRMLEFLDVLNILSIIDKLGILVVYGFIFGLETAFTYASGCISKKKIIVSGRMLVRAFAATILGTFMSVPLAAARVFGMITFHWRRQVW